MTAPAFARAVRETGRTCAVPLGVIEKHGNHLPLGTDVLFVKAVTEMAARTEPVLVFPALCFGQIQEARHVPGAVALGRRVYFDLLENLCEEIARNGCTKIVLVNGHGGNESFLSYFAMVQLERERRYAVYVARLSDYIAPVLASQAWRKMKETDIDAHAGEFETSWMLAIRPDLVRMNNVKEAALPRGRLRHVPALADGIWWYADYPEHYAGDARPASIEKGRYLVSRIASRLSAIFKAVKADKSSHRLLREFFARARRPLGRRLAGRP